MRRRASVSTPVPNLGHHGSSLDLEPDGNPGYSHPVRRLMIHFAASLLLAATTLSCAGSLELSGDEQSSLGLAMAQPLTFTVPRYHSLEVWDRAQSFVDRYSTMKLRSVTDSLVVAYEAPTYSQLPSPVESGAGIRFGYTVSRSSGSDGINIAVRCSASSKLGEKDADQNAHIAAYYISTGTIACARCIRR